MTRLRELGVTPGRLPAGPHNAITDVPGMRVGHVTLIAGEGPLAPGQGPVRTGVTAILPHGGDLFEEQVAAAVHTINGFGKVVGFEQVRELGTIEAPILQTNTMNVGLAADALGTYMMRDHPMLGIRGGALNRVVRETNDGFLNDLRGRHVREEHVWRSSSQWKRRSSIRWSRRKRWSGGITMSRTPSRAMSWRAFLRVTSARRRA